LDQDIDLPSADVAFRLTIGDFGRQFHSQADLNPTLIGIDSTAKKVDRAETIKEALSSVPEEEREKVANLIDSAWRPGTPIDPSVDDPVAAVLLREYPNELWLHYTLHILINASRALSPEAVLVQSLLVSAVASFDALLGRLAEAYCREHPDSLDGIALRLAYDSSRGANDLLEEALSAVREKVSRGSINERLAFFRDKGGSILDSRDKDSLQEIFWRRNLLVHNSVRAEDQYLRHFNDTRLGSRNPRDVNRQYWLESINHLYSCGLLLAVTVWLSAKPQAPAPLKLLATRAYMALTTPLGPAALRFFGYLGDARGGSSDNPTDQVNYWLARKFTGNFEGVRAEIETWSHPALSQPVYRLAQQCLLGNEGESIVLLEQLVDDGALDATELATWPLFHDLRGNPNWPRIYAKAPTQSNSQKHEKS